MAIFGTFEEIPPQDALAAISRQTGVFSARLPADVMVELEIAAGTLLAFSLNGWPLPDVLAVRDRFAQLLSARAGDFEFRRTALPASHQRFHLPIDQLVASAMSFWEDVREAGVELPSEHTRFIRAGRDELWLSDDLARFWEKCSEALETGASALELTHCSGLALPQVQWFLYRLRVSGLIRPRRLTEHLAAPLRVKDAVLPLALSTAAGALPAPDRLRSVPLGQPPAPLLRRLMRGLASFFG